MNIDRWRRLGLVQKVLTLLLCSGLLYGVWPLFRWLVLDANFAGAERSACTGDGACWVFIKLRIGQFLFGFYEAKERWRPILALFLWAASLFYLFRGRPVSRLLLGLIVALLPFLSWALLDGRWLGLPQMETTRWGGLLLTLVISVVGITLSLPLGILLALGRRSRLPLIRVSSVAFIELWRGVPLIAVLFMASVMLPLFLPPGTEINKLLRVLVGVTLFTAAYMAEVIRGGLQAIGRGQYEAASALGFNRWQTLGLVVLPQALHKVIPSIVNTFIGLFKDTSLVLIVGMFDLLGMVQAATTDPYWLGFAREGYVFAGAVFWIFCFGMSRFSLRLERRLEAVH